MSNKTTRPLPTIEQLHNDFEWADEQNQLNRLLAREPYPRWLMEHPFANGVRYLPIQRVEWLLTTIFLKWWVEVRETKVVANSICVTVRLYVIDPISLDEMWQDGVGSVDIQTAKGASATAFDQIVPFAVQKALPAAKSYAIKDAAESFGRIFGKDLNRKDFIAYTNLDGKFDFSKMPCSNDQVQELYALLRNVPMSHDERDVLIFDIQKGITLEDYRSLKTELLDRQKSLIDRVRDGENLKAEEMKKVITAKMNDDE